MIFFFDANGTVTVGCLTTVVRQPTCHDHFQQRCYYYAGVIRLKEMMNLSMYLDATNLLI